jgi:hypothetical protein
VNLRVQGRASAPFASRLVSILPGRHFPVPYSVNVGYEEGSSGWNG